MKPTEKSKLNSVKNSKKRDSQLESLLHSEQIVHIEKMAVGGSGVGRIDLDGQKIVVFVPFAAPDEKINVRITRVEKNFLIGEIITILQPSPERRKAPCLYFSDCGGCNWQHINESAQLNQKEQILKELFQKFVPEQKYNLEKTVQSPKLFEYRNRIQLKQIDKKLGYFKPETHDLVDIDDCMIAEPELRTWLKENKKNLRPSPALKKHELKINANGKVEFYPIGSQSEGLSFSQVNRSVNNLLVELVVSLVRKINPTSLTEFYAGSGNFTFPLAEALREDCKIDAIELNPELTKKAVEQVKALKLQKKVNFYTTSSEIFPLRNKISDAFILLDPPRQGCEKSLLQEIARTKPQAILYISCHPVSLVRDLQVLKNAGYLANIQHLQIFDMFPQTDHFETVCLLELQA